MHCKQGYFNILQAVTSWGKQAVLFGLIHSLKALYKTDVFRYLCEIKITQHICMSKLKKIEEIKYPRKFRIEQIAQWLTSKI